VINIQPIPVLMVLSLALPAIAQAEVTRSTDAETGLKSWALNNDAFGLELIQRLPDQTRGFFQGRGFSRQVADQIATECVLQTIGKNNSSASTGKKSIQYNLQDWKVSVGGHLQGIKLKEQWEREWGDDPQISNAARIAFRWATFPTQQEFEPGGDFNWGMISFGLPPGTEFDLKVRWTQNGKAQSHWIKHIECPADR